MSSILLERAQRAVHTDDGPATVRMLRFAGSQIEQARGELALLSQMRPPEFREFRPALGSVSGFQSPGIPSIQFFCGLRDENVLRIFAGAALYAALEHH
jgi:tryptophan 2,3-dioxygenase